TSNTGTDAGNAGNNSVGNSKPAITVLSPNVDPFYTNTGVISISANITFVTDANKLSVSYNGAQVSFNFDMNTKHLDFTSPLKPGLNTFIINATNNNGSDTRSVNVNYTPVNVNSNTGGTNTGE